VEEFQKKELRKTAPGKRGDEGKRLRSERFRSSVSKKVLEEQARWRRGRKSPFYKGGYSGLSLPKERVA